MKSIRVNLNIYANFSYESRKSSIFLCVWPLICFLLHLIVLLALLGGISREFGPDVSLERINKVRLRINRTHDQLSEHDIVTISDQ